MEYSSVEFPQWADAGNTIIDCIVQFDAMPFKVPFTASSSDVELHGRQIFFEIQSGKYGPISDFIDVSLETRKENAISKINSIVGAWRAQFITVIPGQESTYLLKENEAIAAQSLIASGGIPTSDLFPIICSEASATSSSVLDIVTLVLNTAAQWKQLAAIAEGVRRGAIVAVERANSVVEVSAISVVFPTILTTTTTTTTTTTLAPDVVTRLGSLLVEG